VDEAIRYYLSVSILFNEPALSPECLHRAAELMEKQGRNKESGELMDELRKRYPESPWAVKKP